MSEELSPRARAILDAAERAVVAGTPAVATGAPTPPLGSSGAAANAEARPLPRLEQATAPHRDWSDPAPGSPPVAAPGQLLAIVDQVVQAAEGARRRIDLLSASLDELIDRVDAAARPPGWVAPPLPRPAPTTARSAAAARPAAGPAAVQLLAVEMAVSGATRMEADRRLRDELGVRETRVLLDEVFGEGSAPGARLPWDGTNGR